MLSVWLGEEATYLSFDCICKVDAHSDSIEDMYMPKFLNTITFSGLPNHILTLKIRVPMMLLCNIDQTAGLRNSA